MSFTPLGSAAARCCSGRWRRSSADKEANVVGGDHVVFFGHIERAAYREGEPLIFSAGKYGTHSPLE